MHSRIHIIVGSCAEAGYTQCCEGANCLGIHLQDCFCDANCREFNDCCGDIDDTCPEEQVPVAGEFYVYVLTISQLLTFGPYRYLLGLLSFWMTCSDGLYSFTFSMKCCLNIHAFI